MLISITLRMHQLIFRHVRTVTCYIVRYMNIGRLIKLQIETIFRLAPAKVCVDNLTFLIGIWFKLAYTFSTWTMISAWTSWSMQSPITQNRAGKTPA